MKQCSKDNFCLLGFFLFVCVCFFNAPVKLQHWAQHGWIPAPGPVLVPTSFPSQVPLNRFWEVLHTIQSTPLLFQLTRVHFYCWYQVFMWKHVCPQTFTGIPYTTHKCSLPTQSSQYIRLFLISSWLQVFSVSFSLPKTSFSISCFSCPHFTLLPSAATWTYHLSPILYFLCTWPVVFFLFLASWQIPINPSCLNSRIIFSMKYRFEDIFL